jgi:hypothetical protein
MDPLLKWLKQTLRRTEPAQASLTEEQKAELLARAPYDYSWWQGEDWYRIYHKATLEFVHSAPTQDAAEAWIIERYLAERAARQNNPIVKSIAHFEE